MAIDVSADVLRALPTPCLILDLATCRRNIAVAAGVFSRGPVRLRPHFKAHKCTALMREQLSGGSCVGVTCATAHEAEVLARAGFTDILLANQVVDVPGLGALARAAQYDGVRLGVAVDHQRHIELLDALSREYRIRLDVLIEIDVGMGRCGLAPRDPLLLELARAVDSAPNLRLRGLQAYEGHAVLLEDRAQRRACVQAAAAVLVEERTRLLEGGFPCEVISGGGTGTLDLVAEAGVVTEVQAGSYPLLDATYGALGLSFENALYAVATTLSVARPACATLNAGLKAISAEYGMPAAIRRD
jgi:D-serine deaminase-like pyridoxal phosphate-dependent protein